MLHLSPSLLAALTLLLAACSSAVVGTTSTEATTTSLAAPTTALSVQKDVLQEASDCVGVRIVGEALVLLTTDVDEKIAMAESLSTSEDAREMGISMAESSTDLQHEADRMGELASSEEREDLAEIAVWVESGLQQTANNYNQVVDALIDNDAEALAAAVTDFDRIWPAILDTVAAFAPILVECSGAESDIVQALDEATQ